jgi:hypothetical protein
MTDMPQTPTGWACPKCGAVMAPWRPNCINCGPNSGIQPSQVPYSPWPPYPYWWIYDPYKLPQVICTVTATGTTETKP